MASVIMLSLTAFFHDLHTEKPATLSISEPVPPKNNTMTLTLTDSDSHEYYWTWVVVVGGSLGAHSEHMAGNSGAGVEVRSADVRAAWHWLRATS